MILGVLKIINILTVFWYTQVLLPLEPGEENFWTRINISAAIVEASDDPDDWALLARIARWESWYKPSVADCRQRSSCGASGPFQVIPRSKEEKDLICGDWTESARRALMRVNESRTICWRLPKAEQLAQYATGNCGDLGKKMSRLRYATAKDMFDAVNNFTP